MSEAINFDDDMCPPEDLPFLFDYSNDLNEARDDIASITSIDIDSDAVTAGFETHDDIITDVVNDDPKTGKAVLTVNGGVRLSFNVNAGKQNDVYWDNPGNQVSVTVLITTTGGLVMSLTGLITVSQPS